MKKSKGTIKLLLFLVLLLAILIAAAVFMTKFTIARSLDKALNSESGSTIEVDTFSMQKFSEKNAKAVFSALKSGKKGSLEKHMITSDGIDSVMEFADWESADFDNAVSMGAGSLTDGPDDQGRIDINEKFIVRSGDDRYVIFIETVTSRYGRRNDGISAVAVINFNDFDTADYAWNGEDDKGGALAGKLFWKQD